MNPLLTPQKSLDMSLSGSNPLSTPGGPVPGSGLLSAIGNFFNPAQGAQTSLTGNGSLFPSSSPAASTATLPGIAGAMTAGMPAFPTITPARSPVQVVPAASSAGGISNPLGLPVASADTVGTFPSLPNGHLDFAHFSPDQMTAFHQQNSQTAAASNTGSATTQGAPMNFNTGAAASGSSIPSNYMSPGALQDLLDARNAKQQSLASGTNPDGSQNTNVGSDSLVGSVASQLYQSGLYTPQEKQLLSNQLDMQNQVNYDTLQAKRQIAAMQESGQITQAQSAPMIQDVQDRANARLADLNYNANSAAAQLQAYGTIRQNQVTALGGYLNALQPTQVSPGSSLYNPITGVMYQGQGGSPQAVLGYAQTLLSNDQATGSVHYDANGNIDTGYYQNMSAKMFGGGNSGNTQTGTAGSPGGVTTPGTAGMSSGMSGYSNSGANTGSGVSSIPQQYRGYVIQPSDGTPAYVNTSLVPPGLLPAVSQFANQAGVKIFDAPMSAQIQNLQGAIQDVGALGTLVNGTLRNGVVGRGLDYAAAGFNKIFQNNPNLIGFDEARTTAINNIKGLAGGEGSGLRLNSAEIGIATSNLPTATDNLESAQNKIKWVSAFLNQALNLKMNGDPGSAITSAAEQNLTTLAQKAVKSGNYDASIFGPQTAQASTGTGSTGAAGSTSNSPFSAENFY